MHQTIRVKRKKKQTKKLTYKLATSNKTNFSTKIQQKTDKDKKDVRRKKRLN